MIVDFSPKRKGPPPLLLIGAAVLVLVAGRCRHHCLLDVSTRRSTRADPTPTPTPVVPPKAKADLLPIDGGTFMMGRKNGPPQETPAHPVTVQPFKMDRTEVSNTEYADFVRETNHAAPTHWIGNKPPFGQEMWPVVNVSFDDANCVCRVAIEARRRQLPSADRRRMGICGAKWRAERSCTRGDRSGKTRPPCLKDATPAAVGSRAGREEQVGRI